MRQAQQCHPPARSPGTSKTLLVASGLLDRTIVHRAVKTLIREGLLAAKKADTGPARPVQLTAKGNRYRDSLIKERRNAEEKLRQNANASGNRNPDRLLSQIAEFKF